MKEVEKKFCHNKSISILAITLFLLSGCTNNDFSGNNIQDAQDIQSESGVQDVIQDQEVQDTQDEKNEEDVQEIQTQEDDIEETQISQNIEDVKVEENGTYTSKEEVAAYIHKYNKLPSNFITEEEAKALGWVSKEGNLSEVAPGKSVGGDVVMSGNHVERMVEQKVGKKEGRVYYVCDINFVGGYRGAERIVYSNDGLICYTPDHYETFEVLYK